MNGYIFMDISPRYYDINHADWVNKTWVNQAAAQSIDIQIPSLEKKMVSNQLHTNNTLIDILKEEENK